MSEVDSGEGHPPDEIDLWLDRIQLAQYAASFRANNITLEILPTLEDADLKACGVESLGHRKILLLKIREQFPGAASAGVPTPVKESPKPTSPAKPSAPAVKRIVVPPVAPVVPRHSPAPEKPPALIAKQPAPIVSAAAVAEVPAAPRRWSWKRFGGKFLVASILAHLLFLSGATYLIVQRIQGKRKINFTAAPPTPEAPAEHKVQMRKQETTSVPQMTKRITSAGLSKVALPEMPDMPTQTDAIQPMKMTSDSTMGGGLGMAGGGGNGFGAGIALPSIMADRCSTEGRRKSIVQNGGDPKTDVAVVNALRWLKEHQNADGTWGTGYVGAMTGFSLLCYMGHCERPGAGEFGPTVRNAIDAIIKAGTAHPQGALNFGLGGNGWVYTHAICAYALGEAYIVTKDERIVPVFQKAIALIVAGQRPDGGWCYGFAQPPADTSDTSVTCWMIQALKTAHYSGLNIPGVDQALDKAMGDLLRVHGANGIFGYRSPGAGGELTGAATFCLLVWHHAQSKAVADGLRGLRDGPIIRAGKRPPAPVYKFKDKSANLYAWYYNTQACFQAGGDSWDWWGRNVEPEIVANQSTDGSWPPDGSSGDAVWVFLKGGDPAPEGQIYRAAMCTLMLEVYYRYASNSLTEGAIHTDGGSF